MKTVYKTLRTSMALLGVFAYSKSNAQLALDLAGPGNMVFATYSVAPAAGYTIEFDMYMHTLQNFNAGVTITCSNLPAPVDFYVDASGVISFLSGNCGSFAGATIGSTLTAGVWNHFAYVYNPSTSLLTLYINGSAVGSASFFQSGSSAMFIIGDRADGVTNADAKYDNVRIWSTQRTPSEIVSDMSACLTGSEPGLDILYRFEEGSGATVYDAALANGAQNGIITGSVSWSDGIGGNSAASVTVSACNSYTSPSGNYTWVTSGTYMDTVSSVYGCDSVITVDLTIDNMPFTTTWSNGYATGYSLYNGMFLNDNLGWSVYWAWDVATAYIAKTTDGGATYTATNIPGSYIGDATFVDASTGFACGNTSGGNMIAKSTDGGTTWTSASFATGFINQLNRIVFNDALHGTAAGYGGATYSTSDGGTVWNYSLVDAGNMVFNDIDYVDNSTIWAVGYEYPGVEGRAYLSTDGGATWTLKHSSSTIQNFLGVKFMDALNGFICGGDVLFKTTDGGTTWTTAYTGASGDSFNDIEFGAGKFWLSGSNSGSPVLYTSTDAATWTAVSLSPATTSAANHIMIPSANKVYINGDRLIVGTNTATFNAAAVNPTICAGDAATLVAEGADTYSWSSGDTNDTTVVFPSTTTTYNVTGSSNSCSLTLPVTVTVLQPSSGIDMQSACVSFTWIDGNTYSSSTSTPTFTMTNAVGCDSVITLNLTILNPTAGTDVQTACFSYTWIDGNTYSSSTSTPTFTLTNAAGCDSVVTLNLTINTVNTGVTNTDPTLTASATGATYQWINCGTGFSVIAGETNQSFTASSNGNYAVIVTQSGCSDTSACESVIATGVNELNEANLHVYPNPSQAVFYIETDGMDAVKYTVTSADGRTIRNASFVNAHLVTLDMTNEAKGLYILQVQQGDVNSRIRLMLE